MTMGEKKIIRIRTGGQSGVDRAAMDFARERGIPLCGWCPKGGWAEDYPDPPGLRRDYPELSETPSAGTEQRTKWNMRDADAILTIIPEGSADSKGTAVGLEEGKTLGRPMYTAAGPEDAPGIMQWIGTLPEGTELCIGGPRASECPDAYEAAKAVLTSIGSVFAACHIVQGRPDLSVDGRAKKGSRLTMKQEETENKTRTTLDYYDEHVSQFAEETVNVRFSSIQDRFLQLIPEGGSILDFGCGSGRDSLYFRQKGYAVEACDGSPQMVSIASEYTGLPVKQMLFSELNESDRYDGIFACASILHVPFEELPDILTRMIRALKTKGIAYISFKYGEQEGYRNGRYFTDMNEERLDDLLSRLDRSAVHIQIVETTVTGDVRPGREHEKWLNILLQKTA